MFFHQTLSGFSGDCFGFNFGWEKVESCCGDGIAVAMGENEGWAQASGGVILPNGLLSNASPLIQLFDSERWLKAEKRTAELIACIQPNSPSEERRNAVADYVQRLIMKCFPCQVLPLP